MPAVRLCLGLGWRAVCVRLHLESDYCWSTVIQQLNGPQTMLQISRDFSCRCSSSEGHDGSAACLLHARLINPFDCVMIGAMRSILMCRWESCIPASLRRRPNNPSSSSSTIILRQACQTCNVVASCSYCSFAGAPANAMACGFQGDSTSM